MGFRAIHIDFVGERKFDAILLSYSLLNGIVSLWFLIEKLVAWKSDYLEAILFVHLVQPYQLLVVLLSERSV